MSDIASFTSTVAGRYATALFDLAREEGALDAVEADLGALRAALNESAELRTVIHSPLYSREQQSAALGAVAQAMGLGPLASNLVGLLAARRRLFVLPDLIGMFSALMAEHRGEVTAEVTAARALSDVQAENLRAALAGATGRSVKLNVAVDPAIIGGLIVKVGSRMIDTSIRSKLAGLQNAMKEVG